jgi:hypothetical protein
VRVVNILLRTFTDVYKIVTPKSHCCQESAGNLGNRWWDEACGPPPWPMGPLPPGSPTFPPGDPHVLCDAGWVARARRRQKLIEVWAARAPLYGGHFWAEGTAVEIFRTTAPKLRKLPRSEGAGSAQAGR